MGLLKSRGPQNSSPTAESFGVSAQIGSGVVRGSPEVRFHEGSARVMVPRGSVGDITRACVLKHRRTPF